MEGTQPIRVVVVAPVRIYVQGLAHLLDIEAGVVLAGTAADVDAVVPLLASTDVDVILLDMTGDIAGKRGLTALHRLADATTVPCVVLGIPDRPADVVACAEAGIAGYVTDDDGFTDLVGTLGAATRGEFRCRANVLAGLVGRLATLARQRRAAPVPNLTTRELEIVALIESGYANKEIASLLHIQLTTVKNHVHNILDKLGVRGRGDVAAAVRRQRLSGEPTWPDPDLDEPYPPLRLAAESV